MYILKQYHLNTGKGILIFTHNETNFILNKCKDLLEKYFFVQHVQFNISCINRSKEISLHLMPQYNVAKCNDIPIATNVLIHRCFHYKHDDDDKDKYNNLLYKYGISDKICCSKKGQKPIDFVYCGRIVEFKKTIEVLGYFAHISEAEKKKCVFILASSGNLRDDPYVTKFYKRYDSLDQKVKQNIIILDTYNMNINDNLISMYGFKLEDLSLFYKHSKIYIHGCENEGGSRSIHEALCCGCHVMVKDNLKGGGLDNFSCELQYTLYNDDNHFQKMHDALDKQTKYICKEEYITHISELYMFEKLVKIFYERLNYSSYITFTEFFDICCENRDNVQLKMAAHDLSVPWYDKSMVTSTIKDNRQLERFYDELHF